MLSFTTMLRQGLANALTPGAALTIEFSTAVIIAALGTVLIIGCVITYVLALQRRAAVLELQEKTEALVFMAEHDALTGLINRATFMDQLQERLIKGRHPFLALFVIDVANYRMINDAYGHDMGDRVLEHIAAMLQDTFMDEDVLIGINHTDLLIAYGDATDIENVRKVSEDLVRRLTGSTMINHMEVNIRVNIGVSLAPNHSLEAQLLFKKANMACMEAARMGQNQYSIFQTTIYKDALKRITLEKQLRRAIVRGEFEIYYQPRVDLTTRRVCGCEALIRWNHPEGKVVYPGHFIGIAESHGFISEITKLVIKQVIHQTKLWCESGHRIKVSFNISGKEFDDDFVRMLSKILEEDQGDPSLLEVEITETATLKDMDYSRVLVNTLQNMGITVALDDFGTGYSSMTYIKKLKADKLKIDKSFIEDIDDYQQRVVVESMIELGRKLDYVINVEGVETEDQLKSLETMTVDEVQGWYFSKAVQADRFMDYVLKNSGIKIDC